jgi:uncharacterized protein (DUF1810 family)
VPDRDEFNLQRFVDAQAPVYEQALLELRDGRKTSHWMWFVFPQIQCLGFSPMSVRYAISGRDEAIAYDSHPVLGPRLRQCAALVNAVEGKSAHVILGSPDDLKFRSCMTLFAACAADAGIFTEALQKYFGGTGDPQTTALLEASM